MFVSRAYAQEELVPPPADTSQTTAETLVPSASGAPVPQPDGQQLLLQNVGMIVLLVVMFYFLLIRPQQKRFKEHKAMIDALKKGDRVVTAGGLVGVVDTLVNEEEVIVDLGHGVKVTALRSTIQSNATKDDAKKSVANA